MSFRPRWTFTPRMQRQIVVIERTAGLLEQLRLRPDWTAEARIRDTLSSVQIEGN